MEGERRVVTILFGDVQDSMAMAEQLDPEEWAEIMNSAFQYLIRPVQRYGGTVARLMGDGILAFFGAPLAHEDDPQRAVLAGLEIASGIQEFGEQLNKEYGMDFNVRVGINTGPVVVGEVGMDNVAGEYTAMGDAVNLAARMETTARPGTVQIAEDTYRLVAPLFEVEPLGWIDVRGKSEPVQAYRVLQPKERPGRLRGIAGLASPLVGRERHLQILRASLDALGQGHGSIVALVAEAGLGKTRLIEELRAYAKAQGYKFPWLESRGISYDAARPYGLFRQHYSQICRVQESDPPEVVRAKVARSFSNLAPGLQEKVARGAELLLFSRAGPGGPPLEGEALKSELFESALAIFHDTATAEPLVMVFEDLHWADPASVDLLLHLFRLADQVPLLFLCAFRPYQASPAWKIKTSAENSYPGCYIELDLQPLSEQESIALVNNLLSISDLPANVRAMLLRKSEGNPFFLEEVVRALIDNGLIEREEGSLRWRARGEISEIDIPDSLQALLLARIDRLETDARRTLQLASVIGRSFYYRVLEAIAGMIASLEKELQVLQDSELIEEIARLPELEYIFRHELTREAAYSSILLRRRRQFHLAVGEAIERLYPDRLEQEAHRLGTHFELARDFERALKYYRMAGDAAYRLYASAEAIENYGRAIEFAHRTQAPAEQYIHLYTCYGRSFELLGQYLSALQAYRDLQALGKERDDPRMQLAALLPMATIYAVPTTHYSTEEGRPIALEALGRSRELRDVRAEAKSLWNLMLIEYFSQGDLGLAATYGELAIQIAREHGLKEELAYALNDIVRPYTALGRKQEARASAEEAQSLWRELNNLPMLADILGSTAETYYVHGQVDQALALSKEGLRIAQQIGNPWAQSYTQFGLGLAHLERGEIDASLNAMHASIKMAEKAGFAAGMISARLVLAWVYLIVGDVDMALGVGETLATLNELLGDFELQVLIWRAYRALYTGQAGQARAILDSSGGELPSGDNEYYYAPFVYQLDVQVALADGETERALALARAYEQRMRAAETFLLMPDILQLQGRALLALGRTEEAVAELARAYREALRQGSRRSLWSILIDLIATLEQSGLPGLPPSSPDSQDEAALSLAELRAEAQAVIGFILDNIQDERLRAAFLAQPGVRDLL